MGMLPGSVNRGLTATEVSMCYYPQKWRGARGEFCIRESRPRDRHDIRRDMAVLLAARPTFSYYSSLSVP